MVVQLSLVFPVCGLSGPSAIHIPFSEAVHKPGPVCSRAREPAVDGCLPDTVSKEACNLISYNEGHSSEDDSMFALMIRTQVFCTSLTHRTPTSTMSLARCIALSPSEENP